MLRQTAWELPQSLLRRSRRRLRHGYPPVQRHRIAIRKSGKYSPHSRFSHVQRAKQASLPTDIARHS